MPKSARWLCAAGRAARDNAVTPTTTLDIPTTDRRIDVSSGTDRGEPVLPEYERDVKSPQRCLSILRRSMLPQVGAHERTDGDNAQTFRVAGVERGFDERIADMTSSQRV